MQTRHGGMNFRLPILQGVLPLDASQIPAEIIAGVALAALAIPEVMGYTKIAGMPPITGLYSLLIPLTLFAVFGSSRHLVVGADSATAAMVAAGLADLAATGSAEHIGLAGVVALMAAGLLLLARIIRLGFLADFLSRTVLVGFLSRVGIQVALGQIVGMLGIVGAGHYQSLWMLSDWHPFQQTNAYVLILSATVLVIIVGSRLVSAKIPGALIAVVGGTAASWLLNLKSRGVPVLGTLPSGLPTLGLPSVDLNWPLFQKLIPSAVSIFIVILAQSAATSRAYAARYNDSFK